jgi:hypothetical protein
MYVMLTAICFDTFFKMVYPKFAWTRPYEPPTFDFNDPKRCNFINVQPRTLFPTEAELLKFCGKDMELRGKYIEAWRKANLKSWDSGLDAEWLKQKLAEGPERHELFRKMYEGDWTVLRGYQDTKSGRIPFELVTPAVLAKLLRYATTPDLSHLFDKIFELGYGEAVLAELEQQPVPIDPDLLYDILREFIIMVKVNPNEKAIFKPFPETHA